MNDEIEVRGDLLPLKDWSVEILPDGNAIVCCTVHDRFRQYYRVPITQDDQKTAA